MTAFLIGLLLGGFAGVTFMALFQLSKTRHEDDFKETEDKINECSDDLEQ